MLFLFLNILYRMRLEIIRGKQIVVVIIAASTMLDVLWLVLACIWQPAESCDAAGITTPLLAKPTTHTHTQLGLAYTRLCVTYTHV